MGRYFMTFDFNFDFSEIENSAQQKPLNSDDQAILGLIKSLLRRSDNENVFFLEELSQQLEREFLPWLAMFCEKTMIQAEYQQLQNLMMSYQWNIRHPDFSKCNTLSLDALPQHEIEQLLNNVKIDTDLSEWQTLIQLCTKIPYVIGYRKQFSLVVVNNFHTHIPLQVEDLTSLEKMLIGEKNIKVDLASLITLEIGLPTWIWKNVVLLQQSTSSPSNLSYSQLEQQLQQADTQIALQHPNDQLKQLFKRTQSHGQEHLDEMKQQLSLLTQTLLDDDKFNASELKMIAELQANSRKETTLLKNKIKQFEQFTQNFESTLNAVSV